MRSPWWTPTSPWSSGTPGDTVNRDAWLFLKDAHVPIIEKPFQPALFLDVVRRVTTALTPSSSGIDTPAAGG
ncbi:MAG: hypothetical protein HYU25_17995 [Candidatus Rokubacteria bacterium]|nr:hypothetical protein [Candidatus Rokubacteria bacterium]